jgi:hypothetical protein
MIKIALTILVVVFAVLTVQAPIRATSDRDLGPQIQQLMDLGVSSACRCLRD